MPQAQTTPELAQTGPFAEGLEHLRARRLDNAIASLRRALRQEPGRVAAVRGLATAYLLKGEHGAARSSLADFLRDHPEAAEAWQLAAHLEWKLGKRDAAIELLRRAERALPNNLPVRHQLALFLGAMGLAPRITEEHANPPVTPTAVLPAPRQVFAVADDDWLARAAADPAVLESLLRLPMQLYDQPMLHRLEAKLVARLADQPHHADRHLALARVRAKLGNVNAALDGCAEAIRLNPRFANAHRLAADLHEQAGRPGRAVQILQGLLKQGVHWPDIYRRIDELQGRMAGRAEARAA